MAQRPCRLPKPLGVTSPCVATWAGQEGIILLTRSQARKAALADPAVRAKISAASKAALADPAVRAKISAASKAAWADPAVRAKISAASKAALADPAVRAKISAARKAALADPAVRAKMSAARKAALADPAVRARIKASRKGAKGVLIPRWVPEDLQEEFLDIAAESGEERAASHIRRLKREMAREEAFA